MNRRGDVPTVLLFVVAIGMVIASLFVFATFDNNFSGSNELAEMTSEITFSQSYIRVETETMLRNMMMGAYPNCMQKDLSERLKCVAGEKEGQRLSIAGNLYGKIRNGDFSIVEEEEDYILDIRDLSARSERGANSLEKNFDMHIAFYPNGQIVVSRLD